jgi:type II secretory ATPase GspE/PulE/Tfp pilus assembly ATPase PilB-like protein
MNPFVNPKKRSISLPSGCKDLVDVLKRSESKHDGAIRRFIHLVLFQAQQDQATELVIRVATPSGGTPIRYKVEDTWYDLSPFPSHIRPDVVSELARMAKLPAGQFPNEGVLDVTLGDVRLRWTVGMTSADAECMLVRVQV